MSKARDIVETLRTVLVDGDVTNANFTGADLEVGKGGTGASSAGAARTALGLAIGTDVLAPDGDGSGLTGVDSLPSQTSQSGKFLTTNGSAASWGTVSAAMTLGTPVTTTSASSFDFTGIPSGTKQVIISFFGVSSTASDFQPAIQIGDAGGIETSGYTSMSMRIEDGVSPSAMAASEGFSIGRGTYSDHLYGQVILQLEDSTQNTWVSSGILRAGASRMFVFGGSKSLSAELDRVRLQDIASTAAFDAGEMNIAYIQD